MNTSKHSRRRASKQSGFSLLEVLMSIIVTSIGLIGLAGMQATGLRNNHSAYHNSQAAVLAYDLSDRMRANTGAIANYLTSFMTLAQAVAAGAPAGCESTGGCTAAEMAQNDLVKWHTALTTAIPGAVGIITLTGDVYTIRVSWDDDRSGVVDADDPNFQVAFQP